MNHTIAVVGAHTAVGRNVVTTLADSGIPSKNVVALSCSDAVGKRLSYGEDGSLLCRGIEDFGFGGSSIAIFAEGDGVAERYIGNAVAAGCIVIDGTAHSRKDSEIPLVIPGINSDRIDGHPTKGIIAVPCSMSVQMSTVLFPLHERAVIERVVATTFHAVSHVGREAMSELYDQTKSMFMNHRVKYRELPKQISFNCIPFVGEMEGNEYTSEEIGISRDVRRLLGGGVEVTVTCVYVPVYVSHSAVLNVQFRDQISRDEALEVLENTSNVLLIGGETETKYVTPIDCVNDEEVYVSRVRSDLTVPNGLSMWCVADNLRRSALDIVKIVQLLLERGVAAVRGPE